MRRRWSAAPPPSGTARWGSLAVRPARGRGTPRGRPPRCQDDYAPVEEWPEKERLAFEKESIGFYVSGHPLHQYEKELQRYARPAPRCSARGATRRSPSPASCPALRERPTKTGKRMAWVTLEDLTGSVELVCFPGKEGGRSVMGKDGKWAKGGPQARATSTGSRCSSATSPSSSPARCRSTTATRRTPTAELIVEDVQSLKEVREKRVKRLELRVRADLVTEDRLDAAVRAGEEARRGDAAGGLHPSPRRGRGAHRRHRIPGQRVRRAHRRGGPAVRREGRRARVAPPRP